MTAFTILVLIEWLALLVIFFVSNREKYTPVQVALISLGLLLIAAAMISGVILIASGAEL